jgi:hypothetical protein
VLDSDDLLLPGALRTAIEAFAAHSGIHWVVGRADDLFPGPTRFPFPPMLPPGVIEPATINDFILDHGHTPITCGTGLTVRTEMVRALGGWVATPRAEDLALLVAITELRPDTLLPT